MFSLHGEVALAATLQKWKAQDIYWLSLGREEPTLLLNTSTRPLLDCTRLLLAHSPKQYGTLFC